MSTSSAGEHIFRLLCARSKAKWENFFFFYSKMYYSFTVISVRRREKKKCDNRNLLHFTYTLLLYEGFNLLCQHSRKCGKKKSGIKYEIYTDFFFVFLSNDDDVPLCASIENDIVFSLPYPSREPWYLGLKNNQVRASII